jgi:hypothetical protein
MFSRFVDMYPTTQPTAELAADRLVQFIGRFGRPITFLSDQGVEFDNSVMKYFCKLLDIEFDPSMAGSKENNSIVERANREVLRYLRPLLLSRKVLEDWETYLPLVQRLMNSTPHSATGYTPAQLIFGNSIQLESSLIPLEVAEKVNDVERNEFSTVDYMDKLLFKQQEIMNLAKSLQISLDDIHKNERATDQMSEDDTSITISEFPDNSYVLVMYPKGRMGRLPPSKLHTPWKGPLRVISHVGTKYLLQNLVTNKTEYAHVTALKPFEYDPQRVDPREISLQDQQFFVVSEILDHKGDSSRRSSLEFKVRWLNKTAEDDTWETFHTLRNNKYLHEYLAKHKMRKFIPVQFKEPIDA